MGTRMAPGPESRSASVAKTFLTPSMIRPPLTVEKMFDCKNRVLNSSQDSRYCSSIKQHAFAMDVSDCACDSKLSGYIPVGFPATNSTHGGGGAFTALLPGPIHSHSLRATSSHWLSRARLHRCIWLISAKNSCPAKTLSAGRAMSLPVRLLNCGSLTFILREYATPAPRCGGTLCDSGSACPNAVQRL